MEPFAAGSRVVVLFPGNEGSPTLVAVTDGMADMVGGWRR